MGDGPEADDRAAWLLACGALVRRATLPVSEADLEGAFLVLSTHRDEASARVLRSLADRLGLLLHCEDQPRFSDLALPSVVCRGALTVAISTGGASPALARRLREDLEVVLDERLTALVERLGALRKQVAGLPRAERLARLRAAVEEVHLQGRLDLPEEPDPSG